jgi:6-phosphogluconate dehydrogenase
MTSPTTPTEPGSANVGVIGLAVMGSNLARNLARHGHTVAVFNRTHARTLEHLESYAVDGAFVGCETVAQFVASLERPRRIIIMVKAGAGTDAVIDELIPHLEDGDIVVDGGNAQFTDTRRREGRLRELGLHFVGTGITGGEVGPLNGPSIMPGGSLESYAALGPILESIAARVDGEPCCAWMGPDGAGHFVKMVHNGIEYADMQFIAEAYDVLSAAGMSAPEVADVFREWNTGELDSFLVEITAEVLDQVDPATGKALVEVIVDAAEQKGTGRWTVQSGLELGVPVSTIAESVFARAASGDATIRRAARGVLTGPSRELGDVDRERLVDNVRQALWASKVVAYAQGLEQIRAASDEYGWDVDVATVARIWRGGCIIRARLLSQISDEYAAGGLATLLVAPSIVAGLTERQDGWRRVVGLSTTSGVPVPGFSSALAYYDTVRAERLPAALVQGLRDNFGAHTYGRTDRPGTFHTLWSQGGAEVQVS